VQIYEEFSELPNKSYIFHPDTNKLFDVFLALLQKKDYLCNQKPKKRII